MSGCVEASDGATMGEVVMVTGLVQRRRNAKVITVETTDCDVHAARLRNQNVESTRHAKSRCTAHCNYYYLV